MAAKVDIYWPRAKVADEDGNATELKVEEGLNGTYAAYKQLKQWREEYGERIKEELIEVRGEKRRLKYTIYVKD